MCVCICVCMCVCICVWMCVDVCVLVRCCRVAAVLERPIPVDLRKHTDNTGASKLDSNNDDSIDLEEWIEVGLRTPSVLTLLGSGNFDLFSESHRDAQHYEVELV